MKRNHISALTQLADVLRAHPGVRDAAACRLPGDDDQNAVAFVLADEKYVDDVLGRILAEKSRLRVWRKTYDLTQFAKSAGSSPLAFNILGWNSIYTRRPIPEEDMREWVQTTVERISTLNPKNVLEIGCGTGLLLLRLAPLCTRYVGVDFSPAVLQKLKEQLAQMPEISEKVEILEQTANDLEDLAEDSFDTLIINSAAQYFPTLPYLNRVLENAVRVVKPGGHIFVGDKLSLPLLKTYALSVEAFDASPGMTVAEVRDRVKTRLRQEQQLVLSPDFFLSMGRRHSKISRVDIYPRRGALDNEMTRFRYDAILQIGPRSSQTSEIPFVDPPEGGWTLAGVSSTLTTKGLDAIGIARIPNSRVARHAHLLELLANADPELPFADLCKQLDQHEVQGVHPEALGNLAAEQGYEVAMSWASCHSDGSFDAAFLRARPSGHALFPVISWPQPAPADTVYRAYEPGQFVMREKLVEDLVSYCSTRGAAGLVAKNIYVVDSLPVGDDGSVDYKALLAAASETANEPALANRSLL